MDEFGIYLHLAVDGKPHCSYDLEFKEVDQLSLPEDTMFSTLEYIEGQLYQEDDFEEFLESVPTEEIRAEGAEPPQVGWFRYEDGRIEEVEVDLPDDFSEWWVETAIKYRYIR